MKKIGLSLIAIFALLAGYLLSQQLNNSSMPLQNTTWLGPQARGLPSFSLKDQNQQPFTRDQLMHQWSVLFFGYTHCPDICPGTLAVMNQMSQLLKPEIRNQLQIVFVSVDPNRDTPEQLKGYIDYFNPAFKGVSGTPPQLQKLTQALGVVNFIEGDPKPDEAYEVAHSASIFVINPAAQFIGLMPSPHDASVMAQDIETFIKHSS